MSQIIDCIKARRSVRTFDPRPLDHETRAQLAAFMDRADNPFGLPVSLRFLDGSEHGLVCPVASGARLYVGGKIARGPLAFVAFGYSFETFILYAQSLGLGTVWLGGTMNRSAFETAMELGEDEIMPCATPVGYPAKKISLPDSLMRKAIHADDRLPFESLFFQGDPNTPLSRQGAGKLAQPLEMVRLAPSAVNKQPWRVVVAGNRAHFYLKRTKGYASHGELDMQMVDMGIALCHFMLTANSLGMAVRCTQADPGRSAPDMEYIMSCHLD